MRRGVGAAFDAMVARIRADERQKAAARVRALAAGLPSPAERAAIEHPARAVEGSEDA